MELENIVANTVLMKAKESTRDGKGRSKRWRSMLQFSEPTDCEYLRDTLELSYDQVVNQQPIGELLFEEFCDTDNLLSSCWKFIRRLEDYRTLPNEKLKDHAQQIFEEFLTPQPKLISPPELEANETLCNSGAEAYPNVINHSLLEILSPEVIEETRVSISEAATSRSFNKIEIELRSYFIGEPFQLFKKSKYFLRFLQWKHLERQSVSEDKFRIFRVLGKGGFGEVFAAQSKISGKMYAIKKLEKKRVKKKKAEDLALTERKILELVDSRFVVNLAYAYETKDSLCLVLTLMGGGELKYHIYEIGHAGLPLERAVFYAAEIAAGLSHLHDKRILYRDMKPENILLDERGHVRISDLGLAIRVPEGTKVKGRVGTAGYMAPEVLKNESYIFAIDWWGLGCVIYEMIAGRPPFREKKERVNKDTLDNRVLHKSQQYTPKFNVEASLICTRLLDKNPSTRLGGKREVFEDPFFNTIHWPQLESGKLEPPYAIDPRAIYAKDVMDIDQFSSVRGINLNDNDVRFYEKFSIGAVPYAWQREVIETTVYHDLNQFPVDGSLVPVAYGRGRRNNGGGWKSLCCCCFGDS
ncbi:G protein-coupled receptor kinase 4 [Oopsacas minuta]|uniref:G protein-coupled receptor kinase n=1 Tax=Oopsacas minuta TaxID=111878 RepID=A0AAV7K6G4_9METZ|nr:G protein-coupled receptor kinase 4 [Oopsacas minuta]